MKTSVHWETTGMVAACGAGTRSSCASILSQVALCFAMCLGEGGCSNAADEPVSGETDIELAPLDIVDTTTAEPNSEQPRLADADLPDADVSQVTDLQVELPGTIALQACTALPTDADLLRCKPVQTNPPDATVAVFVSHAQDGVPIPYGSTQTSAGDLVVTGLVASPNVLDIDVGARPFVGVLTAGMLTARHEAALLPPPPTPTYGSWGAWAINPTSSITKNGIWDLAFIAGEDRLSWVEKDPGPAWLRYRPSPLSTTTAIVAHTGKDPFDLSQTNGTLFATLPGSRGCWLDTDDGTTRILVQRVPSGSFESIWWEPFPFKVLGDALILTLDPGKGLVHTAKSARSEGGPYQLRAGMVRNGEVVIVTNDAAGENQGRIVRFKSDTNNFTGPQSIPLPGGPHRMLTVVRAYNDTFYIMSQAETEPISLNQQLLTAVHYSGKLLWSKVVPGVGPYCCGDWGMDVSEHGIVFANNRDVSPYIRAWQGGAGFSGWRTTTRVFKLDLNGKLLWAKDVGPDGHAYRAYGAQFLPGGRVLVTGLSQIAGLSSKTQGFMTVFGADGVQVPWLEAWQKKK